MEYALVTGEKNGKVTIHNRPIEMWRFYWLPNSSQVEMSNKGKATIVYLDKSLEMKLAWPAGDPEQNPIFFSRGHMDLGAFKFQVYPSSKYITNPKEFPW